jgi:hypothetical protein
VFEKPSNPKQPGLQPEQEDAKKKAQPDGDVGTT